MNDLLLIAVVPISIVTISIIYAFAQIFLQTRDDCSHTWSRWSDPQKGDAHPYQTRSCNKCNMHQSRLVQ